MVTLEHGRPIILDRTSDDGDRCVNGIARMAVLHGSLYLCRWAGDTNPAACVRPHLQEWRWIPTLVTWHSYRTSQRGATSTSRP